MDSILEVLKGIECSIDGGETQVGDDVEVAQKGQDRLADLIGGHVGYAGRTQLLLHLLGEDRELIVRDWPALAGLFHAGDDLVAGEGFNHARAFDDLERRRFQGRETLLAVRALATTPDRGAVVRDARVDDARVRVMTERTVHPSTVHAPSARCHRSPASHFTERARRRADRAAELR